MRCVYLHALFSHCLPTSTAWPYVITTQKNNKQPIFFTATSPLRGGCACIKCACGCRVRRTACNLLALHYLILCTSESNQHTHSAHMSSTLHWKSCVVSRSCTWPSSWYVPSRLVTQFGRLSCSRQACPIHRLVPTHTALHKLAEACGAPLEGFHLCHRPQWHCSKSCPPCTFH